MANWWDKYEVVAEPPKAEPAGDKWWDKYELASTSGQREQEAMTDYARGQMQDSHLPNLYPAAMRLGASVMAPVARSFGADRFADRAQRMANAFETVAEETAAKDTNYPIVARAFRGAASQLPTAILAGRAMGPMGAIGTAGVQEADRSYVEAKDAGLSEQEAADYATRAGALEFGIAGAMQKIGLGGIESIFGTPAAKQAVAGGIKKALLQTGKTFAQEEVEELATGALQSVNSQLSGVDPTALTPESLWKMVQDTTAQNIAMVGAAEGPRIAQSIGEQPGTQPPSEAPSPDEPPALTPEQIGLLATARQATQGVVENRAHQLSIDETRAANEQAARESQERVQQATERNRVQDRDASFLDNFIRQRAQEANYPVEQPTVGGIRQLPVSPDIPLESRNPPPAYDQSPEQVAAPRQPRMPAELPPVELESGQQADMGLADEWQSLPEDAPVPTLPGGEVYTARDGQRYVRRGSGVPFQRYMQAREAELRSMNIGQLNQEGSKHGLLKGLNKGKKVSDILAAEESAALNPRQYAPEPTGPMIEPAEPAERNPVMLGLPNPISEIYEPSAYKQPAPQQKPKRLTDPVSVRQAALEQPAIEPAAVEAVQPTAAAEPPIPEQTVKENGKKKVAPPLELAALNRWLADADGTEADYDAKSIRAQLLKRQLERGAKTPEVAAPKVSTRVTAQSESSPASDQPSLSEPLPPSGPTPALTIPANPVRITGATNIPGAKLVSGVGDWLKKWMTSAGNLPEAAYELAQKKDGSIARESKQLHFELSELRDAVSKDGGTKLSPVGADLINGALRGDARAASQLPPAVRDKVQAIRSHIDTLSRRLIDNGLAQGKLEVTIEENMGSYVTRSYQVFDDPKWKGKVPQEVRNKAHALLKQENPSKSDHEIANMIDDMLTKEGATALISGRRLGGKDLSITKSRKDISPEIRALLGEYKDPYVNAARAITKMGHLASNHEFLTEVREAGMGKFFFAKDDPKRPSGYNSQFAAESSEVMSPLNGLMTTPEIKEAFDAAYGANKAGGDLTDWAFKQYMKGVVATKFSKTVLSPQALVRNFTGNTFFAIQNGHWRANKVGAAAQATAESLKTGMPQFVRNVMQDNKKAKERFLRYTELGLTHGDIYSGDLKAAIRDVSNDVPAEVESNPFYRLATKGLSGATEAYQSADTIWKIYAFENELARYKAAYKKAGVNKTDAAIEQEAADIVRNTYPTYDKIPAAIRSIRRAPVVGAFVSFPAEVMRTTFHSFKQTAKELSDPALQGIGAQRLAGNLLALAIPSAIAAGLRMLSGISLEDDEDMREFLPPWSKNSDIAWLYKGEDGKPGWIDMSYTLPSSVWRKPLNAMMRGEDWEASFKDAAMEFLEPYFGEELLAERIFDVMRNKKANGGEVYNETASDVKKLSDITLHVAESAEPGILTTPRRISKAAKGTIEPSGRAYNLAHEIIAPATGLRIQETDIPTSLGFAASDYSNQLADATKIFTSKYGSRGTVGEGEVSKAYQESDASRRKLFEQMSRKARAAISLGVSEQEVAKVMRASGIAQDGVRGILAGQYTPYVPSPEIEKRAAKSAAYKARRKELLSSVQ